MTCTARFDRGSAFSGDFSVISYAGTQRFDYEAVDEAGTFKTIYSSQLDQNQSDNKFAGWHEQIEAYFGYPTYYDQATGVHK